MESQLYRQSGYLCKLSPNGDFVANATENRLVIRSQSSSLSILHVYECIGVIHTLQWSPDSQYLLTRTDDICQIWSLKNTHWRATIEDEQGIAYAWWAPDSESVLCNSNLKVKRHVFDLIHDNSRVARDHYRSNVYLSGIWQARKFITFAIPSLSGKVSRRCR